MCIYTQWRCNVCYKSTLLERIVVIPTLQGDSGDKFASAICYDSASRQVAVYAKLWTETSCYVCQFRLHRGDDTSIIWRHLLYGTHFLGQYSKARCH